MQDKYGVITLQEARDLVNKTVGDMTSSLGCNDYSLGVIKCAIELASRRKMKSHIKILRAKLRKMIKTDKQKNIHILRMKTIDERLEAVVREKEVLPPPGLPPFGYKWREEEEGAEDSC